MLHLKLKTCLLVDLIFFSLFCVASFQLHVLVRERMGFSKNRARNFGWDGEKNFVRWISVFLSTNSDQFPGHRLQFQSAVLG